MLAEAALTYKISRHQSQRGGVRVAGGMCAWAGQLYCTGSLTNPTEHHFTGKERDAESGLDYFGARYYSSNMDSRYTRPTTRSARSVRLLA